MERNKNSSSASTNLLLATGAGALFAISSLFLAAGTIISQWDSPTKVIVKPSEFSWLGGVQISGASIEQDLVAVAPAEIAQPRASLIDPSFSPPRYVMRKVKSRLTHVAKVKAPVAKPAAQVVAVADQPLVDPVPTVDPVVQTQAAPERALSQEMAQVDAADEVSAAELETMRSIHGVFQRGFETALNLSPYLATETIVTTQAAAEAQPEPNLQPVIQKVSTHRMKAVPLKPVRKVKRRPAPAPAQVVEANDFVEPAQKPASEGAIATLISEDAREQASATVAQATSMKVEYSPGHKVSAAQAPVERVEPTEAKKEEGEGPEELEANVALAVEPAQLPVAQEAKSETSPEEESPSVNSVEATAPREVARVASATQATSGGAHGYSYSFDYPRPVATSEAQGGYSLSQMKNTQACDATPDAWNTHPYIQAFHWADAVFDGATEELTRESANPEEAQTGWRVSKSANAWPTLHWSTKSSVPLVSLNSIRLLGTLLKTPIQTGMGVIIGRLPCGYTIEFSGRAEIHLLSADNLPIAAGSEHLARTFVLVNAAPGMHLTHLVERATGKSVALATPVMAGTTTYLEVQTPTARTATGVVLDASSRDARPMAGAWVEVVGQPSKRVRTNAKGEFKIEGVLTLGSQPVFFQTDAEDGFTHRYRILPDKLAAVTLFRLDRHQIETWMGQLAGGVSAESGLIVAAMPKTVQDADEALYPSILPFHERQTLVPETYSISPGGQLQVNTPLTAEASRFIGAQIPEGAVIAQVEDKSQKVRWSELVPTGKGIVNLIGPY